MVLIAATTQYRLITKFVLASKRMRVFKTVIGVVLLLGLANAKGDIIEISPLNFGTVVIVSNNTPERIILNHSGGVGYTSGIYAVTAPSVAEFMLTNYPPSQLVFISANSIQAQSNSDIYSADQFTLTNVDTPSTLTTDPTGAATLYVGGTLETSGSGTNSYLDTRYTINYQVTINY